MSEASARVNLPQQPQKNVAFIRTQPEPRIRHLDHLNILPLRKGNGLGAPTAQKKSACAPCVSSAKLKWSTVARSLPQHEERHPSYQNRCGTRRRKCLINNEDPKEKPRELNACVEMLDTGRLF